MKNIWSKKRRRKYIRYKRVRIKRDSKKNNKEGRRMCRRWIKKVKEERGAETNKGEGRTKKK